MFVFEASALFSIIGKAGLEIFIIIREHAAICYGHGKGALVSGH